MSVDSHYRRQGLAKALLTAVVNRAKAIQLTAIELSVIQDLVAAK